MTEHEQLSKDIADLTHKLDKTEFAANVLAEVVKELIKINIYLIDKAYGESSDLEAVEVKRRVCLAADIMGLRDGLEEDL